MGTAVAAAEMSESLLQQDEVDLEEPILDWKEQITIRGLVVSAVLGALFCIIMHNLSLTVGIVPSFNIAAGLLGFFSIKSWTKLGFSSKPFTRQENTVIQTCVVACYSYAVSVTLKLTDSNTSKLLLEEKKRDEIFLRDKIPLWVAAAGYVCLVAVSMSTMPLIFPPLKWYLVLCSYIIAPALAFCNSYGTGLTDWSLASTYGKIGLFIIASIVGSNGGVLAGLAACGVMMSIVSTAADLMQDFKTGYLTKSSAKSMFVSQIVGTAMGCVIAPLTFWMYWTAFDIGSPDSTYKAPYAVIYREMAILGVEGFSELPQHCLAMCTAFFVAALAINLLRDLTPKNISQYIPIPIAMAVPFYIGAYFAIDMFIGTVILFIWERINRKDAEDYAGAVASGLICGDGIWTIASAIFSIFKLDPPICMDFKPSGNS
ncbi:probable metal-nicotianamine transporter YSL6 [Salvia hispanica]|uniref:probable metal-nicotianamine transporter YSL6 n=1 Tax=Salvia hispanica TaxID=49212 RepID=UPI0020093B58|nr:probable metal-nicotianamine transporter YSL6 [Salvia hispanica]